MSRLARQFKEYRAWASQAQDQTGKSWPVQLAEIRALRRMGGQCGVSDYYWYKLYDDDYLLGRGRPDFLGWRAQAVFSQALNPRSAVLPAWDKGVFMLMATAAGLPVAPVLACFHPAARISEALGRHLRSVKEAGAFLRNASIYPLFGKPGYSQQGYGAAYLASYDPAADSIQLPDGGSIKVDAFLARLVESVDRRYHKPQCGYLFQKPLTLASELQTFTHWPAICGVRVVCLNGPEGAVPIRAMWKIAAPPNYVDNFHMGENGNLIADVDLVTGEISRVVGGFWPTTEIFTHYPFSGQPTSGLRLPGWGLILDACKLGGTVFPLMKIHHWDFALTDQGPLILELNDLGATEFAQLHGRGLLTLQTREFLKRHANVDAHPWIKNI